MPPFGVGKRSCIGQALGRLENNLMMCRFDRTFGQDSASQKLKQGGPARGKIKGPLLEEAEDP